MTTGPASPHARGAQDLPPATAPDPGAEAHHGLLDLPGLLTAKRGARPKDQLDAALLEAAIRELGKQGP